MGTYKEEQLIDGAIARDYSDRTSFIYRKWDTRNVFVESIDFLNDDAAFINMKDFLLQKKNKNVYVYVKPGHSQVDNLLNRLGFEHLGNGEVNGTHVNYVLQSK